MCEFTTIAATAAVVGMTTGGVSSYKSQDAQNKALEYNAKLSDRQGEINDIRAADAKARGAEAAQRQRQKTKSIVGSQRADFGASGAVVDKGSTLDVVLDTAELGELDAMTIQRNADLEGFAFEQEAITNRANARLYRSQRGSPTEAAATSILTQGSSLAAQYGFAGM